jgi:WD40 repeat protein
MRPRIRFPWGILLAVCGVSLAAEPMRDRYGDPLPEGASARLGCLRLRPEWPVITGAFSTDGKLLATGGHGVGSKGVVTIWKTATGKVARRLPDLPFSLYGLRFSADGKSLFLVGSDGNIRIVDPATGAEQKKFEASEQNALLAVDVARDGKTAVTTDHRGNIVVWNLSRGDRLREYQIPANRLFWNDRTPFAPLTALTPDGKQLVLPHADGSLHLMDVASGKKVVAVEMPATRPGAAPNRDLQTVAVSPDGRYLAYGNRYTPAALCDLKTGKRLHSLTAPQAGIVGLFFMPDSRVLTVVSYESIRLFDTASGKEIRKLAKSSGAGYPLALSPDGKILALHEAQHALSLWDVGTGRKTHSAVRHTTLVQSIVFFPDGKRLASSDQSCNRIVWDIASAQVVAHHEAVNIYDKPRSLAVDVDGKTLRFLTFNYMIHRWNPMADGKASRQKLPEGNPTDFVLSPDGRTLAATYLNVFQVQLRDLQSDKPPRTIALPDKARLRGFLFSPDSRMLLTGAYDYILRVWERDTGKLVRQIPGDAANNLQDHWTFAVDSRSLAYSYPNGQIFIRELASGEARLQVSLLRVGPTVLAYSPNGRFLAAAQYDGSVFLFGTATGKQLARWQGSQGTIYSLAFSPDSHLVASGGGDGTILLWKLPDGEGLPATLKAEQAVELWRTLADADAARANRALAGLSAAPAQAVPLIKQRFPIPAKKPDAERLARLIAELDDDSFAIRERATRQLSEADFAAADALHQALAKAPSAEAKRRIDDLLNRLKKGGSPERLRALRAVEVLERIGTPQSKELLRELADKPLPDELRDEVQASLRRLQDRP